jgi:hypothetical protein
LVTYNRHPATHTRTHARARTHTHTQGERKRGEGRARESARMSEKGRERQRETERQLRCAVTGPTDFLCVQVLPRVPIIIADVDDHDQVTACLCGTAEPAGSVAGIEPWWRQQALFIVPPDGRLGGESETPCHVHVQPDAPKCVYRQRPPCHVCATRRHRALGVCTDKGARQCHAHKSQGVARWSSEGAAGCLAACMRVRHVRMGRRVTSVISSSSCAA